MDMNVIKLPKTLCLGVRIATAVGVKSIAILAAGLALWLAGCSSPRSGSAPKPTSPPAAETKGAQELAAPVKPPGASPKLAQAAPSPARRVTESKPQPTRDVSQPKSPPATPSKGAEKLVAFNAPIQVRARERTTLTANSPAPKTALAQDSNTVAGTAAKELVFKGPPPQPRPHRSATKPLVFLGLVLGCAALAVVTRICLARRAIQRLPTDGEKDHLKMPSELLFKEPVGSSESSGELVSR